MNRIQILLPLLLTALLTLPTAPAAKAQQRIFYSGTELSDPNFHDGRLIPVIGAHNIQVMRANRARVAESDGFGWTYNHQSMLAYWRGKFYYEYLSDPRSEHVFPSHSYLMTSEDGYRWSFPQVLFPAYKVPDGTVKRDKEGRELPPATDAYAVMHQRMCFHVAQDGRLLAMGYYGIALNPKDSPVDGNGIGRVVREIYGDGRFGPIYFIRYNHGFDEKNTDYPFYTRSKDKGFVRACEEVLRDPLRTNQWAEEQDRGDKLVTTPRVAQAMSYYHLPDGRVVGLWKHALTAISPDEGRTWDGVQERARGFVNSNAKIWGQRLSDGTYATVYNPSEFRWPLALSLSGDGIEYKTLNVIHGEISPMRYGGHYKSYGPQYVRGIVEGNGTPPDGALWVAYSVNKEDMWITRVPVPVRSVATAYPDDDFSRYGHLSEMEEWNIYSPRWAPVSLTREEGRSRLTLADRDPYDYAKVERVIPATRELTFEMVLRPEQSTHGRLRIEFKNARGLTCAQVELTEAGTIQSKGGYRYGTVGHYEAGKELKIKIEISVANRTSTVTVNGGKPARRMLFAPVESVSRIALCTGETRRFPDVDTPTDPDNDLPQPNDPCREARYHVTYFRASPTTAAEETAAGRSSDDGSATGKSDDAKSTAGGSSKAGSTTGGSTAGGSVADEGGAALLQAGDFRHFVDRFNTMEEEHIAQAVPNAGAWEWMKRNIPLFDAPDHDFTELYYYRWWTLRKHLQKTPAGYAMTEFLVPRSYADRYNLIACAVGHHIYESRWLHDRSYLNQIIHTWLRGNDGHPMEKLLNFSSWIPDAVWAKYTVDGDRDYAADLFDDLEAHYAAWESTHRLANGLYWQEDVRDGMEESISGGRKKRYARPSINSYMYGNAVALSRLALLAGRPQAAERYRAKAEELRQAIESKLWNGEQQFFETLRGEEPAGVREAIGFIPWYFHMPSSSRFEVAWTQLNDEKGFKAPAGITTAERRHPEFRSHGTGRCEWDGAVWPFATAQTLTALANYLCDSEKPVITRADYFRELKKYVESQHHRGRPYIGEYLDEVTGYWLMGDRERSRHYNHSTFNDLIITGLCGLRPSDGEQVKIDPLLPDGVWPWFCLDGIVYHGRRLTILWDRDGQHYRQGCGLALLVDGQCVARRPDLGPLEVAIGTDLSKEQNKTY